MKRMLSIGAVVLTLAAIFVIAATATAGPESCDTRVNNTHNKLLKCVTLEGVRDHQAALQAIADDNGGTRFAASQGYYDSVDYVAGKLTEAGYNVTVQPFDYLTFYQTAPSNLQQVTPGTVQYIEDTDYMLMDYSASGNVTASVWPVDLQLGLGNTSNSGCEAADFAGFPAGSIALLQRGVCTFQAKAENAAAAGAVGAIIFNQGNTTGRTALFGGTLSQAYAGGIPVFSASYDLGAEWASTPGLTLYMVASTFSGSATTYNVLAESVDGDPNNVIVVGAHLDSVDAGPGIQDNGSGSAAILEVAEQMAKVKPHNKVRFAWWAAEESGLVGSTHYVNNLTQAERDQIALYLNFDMVGSPNHVFFVYDGDDSDGVGAGPGPEGSAQIEEIFEHYYGTAGQPFKGTDFSGRSDYGPFIAVGIPSGGLFTGADGIKTADEAGLWGGTAGVAYDPCYHQACDTYDNVNLSALDVNSDAIAYATLQVAMNTEGINGERGKGNFQFEYEGDHQVR